MAAPRVKAHESGPGIYRFLLGDAVLECRRNLHDDERFAASLEFLLALAEEIIQRYPKWWATAMHRVLLDANGKPMMDPQGKWIKAGVDIPKSSQYKRFACLVVLLRKSGQFDKQKQDYEDAIGFFDKVLDERGGYDAKKAKTDEEDDDEDEDEDEEEQGLAS